MGKFLKYVADTVFSFGTVMILFGVAFIYAMYNIADQDAKARALSEAQNRACYTQGMVLVDSAAGKFCAVSTELKKIK